MPHYRTRPHAVIAAMGIIGLIACNITAQLPPTVDPFANAVTSPATLAPIITATKEVNATRAADQPTDTPAPSPTSAINACGEDTRTSAARYDINAQISAQREYLIATMTARYRNDSGIDLDTLVMNVDPNRSEGIFKLESLTSSHGIRDYTLNEARLTINLSKPLKNGCAFTAELKFTVFTVSLDLARMKYLSHTGRQITFGHWSPEFAPRVRNAEGAIDWFIPRSWVIGEYMLSLAADYTFKGTITDAPNAILIAPGDKLVSAADGSTTYTLRGARGYAFSVSAAMVETVTSEYGIELALYTFRDTVAMRQDDGTVIDPVGHAMKTARQALTLFTELYGQQAYKRIVLVESDFPDGQEFSGIAYVGHTYFTKFEGKQDQWLTLITAHEIAHQWWYSQIGSDQGNAPYLDEALSIYSEVLYLERYYPQLVPWWWTFRVKVHQPIGYVDSDIYEYFNIRLYINAVYLRGATMLQELRDTLGDDAFRAWIRRYLKQRTDAIAVGADLWGAMTDEEYARTRLIRETYLKNPDPRGVFPTMQPTE